MSKFASTKLTTSNREIERKRALSKFVPARSRMWAVNLTSLLFIMLQSACTAVIAFSGIGAVIGLGSFAAALGLNNLAGTFHQDIIRIPMMAIALTGSAINLYVLWRARSLRIRPASQWRIRPLTRRDKLDELFRLFVSLLTIALVFAEWISHQLLHSHR